MIGDRWRCTRNHHARSRRDQCPRRLQRLRPHRRRPGARTGDRSPSGLGRILAATPRKRTETFRPAWGLLFLRETFDAASARDVHDVYEFHVDDSLISVLVDDGKMQVIEGQTGRPVDVEIHVDTTTFIDVGVGRLRGRDAIRRGKLRLVGSEAALRRYSSIIRPLAGAGAVSMRSGRR